MPEPMQPIRRWVERLIYALTVSIMTIALLVAFGTVWEAYFNAPPVTIASLDPADLGFLCPGDTLVINNDVTIKDNIIIHYFVSVMDKDGYSNMPGAQRAYTDFLHPYPAHFAHHLPWTVPELEPGEYLRVFAVRKVSGNQDTVFTSTKFSIGDNCQ